jgi:MFS family permease
LVILMLAFGSGLLGLSLSPGLQFALIALGGFIMTCTVGPTAAIVIDVVHPGVRATGCSVLALFQNLFGLALGPFIAGLLSDVWGLESALATMPLFGAIAAASFVIAAGSYESEKQRASESSPPVAQASAFA